MRLIAPVEERLRREAMIVARHTADANGCMVELGMSDGKGDIAHLRLLCADETQAKRIEKRFRKNAEGYYQRIMEMLEES